MRWLFLGALAGCADRETAAWALQHGTVTVSDGTFEGYQIWEFYNARWDRTRNEKDHLCSRVQEITGAISTEVPLGCLGCVATYQIVIDEVETDCEGPEADDDSYGGVATYALGEVNAALSDDDPYPGESLGWYVAWAGGDLNPMGYAGNQALDQGLEPALDGWSAGAAYTLWPAYVWEL